MEKSESIMTVSIKSSIRSWLMHTFQRFHGLVEMIKWEAVKCHGKLHFVRPNLITLQVSKTKPSLLTSFACADISAR